MTQSIEIDAKLEVFGVREYFRHWIKDVVKADQVGVRLRVVSEVSVWIESGDQVEVERARGVSIFGADPARLSLELA